MSFEEDESGAGLLPEAISRADIKPPSHLPYSPLRSPEK